MPDPNTPSGRLQALAGQIAAFDVESLIHPAQAGTYDFESSRALIKFVLSFYADIASTDLSYVPHNVVERIHNDASDLLRWLNVIKNFNFRQGDPNQTSNQHVQNLNGSWREAYINAAPHVALSKVSSSAIAQELQTIKATANDIRASWAKASEDHKSQKETTDKQLAERFAEFEKVIAAAREASGKEAVSRQAREFEDEAKKCLTASRCWFAATILTVAASLFVVYWMFLKELPNPLMTQATQSLVTNSVMTNLPPIAAATSTDLTESKAINHAITIEALQKTVARILIVTILYSIVVWVARNYFANRHNYTVNRHRRNAMQTFRAFVEGTKDLATQDFILRQAAACAFAPQQTGYLKDESLPTPAPTSQFIDIVKPGGN